MENKKSLYNKLYTDINRLLHTKCNSLTCFFIIMKKLHVI